MTASRNVVPGTFFGAEIEPGTFHAQPEGALTSGDVPVNEDASFADTDAAPSGQTRLVAGAAGGPNEPTDDRFVGIDRRSGCLLC